MLEMYQKLHVDRCKKLTKIYLNKQIKFSTYREYEWV